MTGAAIVAALFLTGCDETKKAPPSPSLSGVWKSGGIPLNRGGFSELYFFTLTIEEGGEGSVMDLAYTQGGDPLSERVIRQHLAVSVSEGTILLSGSEPHLVSGPALVGVYEPDTLACAPLADASPSALDCRWGSDAHGNGPRVLLDRKGG